MAICGPSCRWPTVILALLMGVLLALGPSPKAYAAPAYAAAPCPVEVPAEHVHRVRCGVLTVPERRDAGSDSTRTIRLPVAIIASRSATPAPDPLVFPTAGGPGAGTMTVLRDFLELGDWAAHEREIILVEQRGDHAAVPTLDCTEMDARNDVFEDPPDLRPASAQLDLTSLKACRDRLVAEGVDLTAYLTVESAADLTDLRRALGYDEWNLYGVSYGSRLALETMRHYPEGLRAVILDGLDPPNVNGYQEAAVGYLSAVRAMLAACATDPRCNALHPDVERSLVTILERTREAPLMIPVKHPHTRSPTHTAVRDTDITAGLYSALYDPNLVRVLPFVIDRLERGDYGVVLPLAQQSIDSADDMSEGLYWTVTCAERFSFFDESRHAETYVGHELLVNQNLTLHSGETCESWGIPAAPAAVTDGVVSDIPTLLSSGGYDPVTPPANAAVAASGLSQHYSYTFPTMGHVAVLRSWYDPCPAAIAQQFLHDPTIAPDASCIATMPPTKFLTTDDIHPTPAIYHLNSDVIEDRNPGHIALLITTLTTLFAGLVYGVVTLISRRARHTAAGLIPAVSLALAVAVLNLGFAAGLTAMILTADPLILGFGIPTAARPLGWIAIAGMVATVLLLILVGRAWWRRNGALGHRVALSAVLVASAAFSVWLVSRGLIIL